MAIHPRIAQPAKRDWTKVRLQHFPELTLLFNKELQIFSPELQIDTSTPRI